MINPYQNREKSALAIKRAEFIARWTATLTTSIGGGLWGYSIALKYLPEGWDYSQHLAALVGLAFSVVLGWITDHAFGDLLQRVVTDAVAARHPNAVKWEGDNYFKRLRKMESIGFVLVLAALFAFDAYTTLIIRDPVAEQAKQIQITDIAAETAKVSAQQQAATAPMARQISTLKSDIASTERRINANNGALTKLISSGNAWAQSELAKKKSAATKASRAELDKLTASYTTALGSEASTLAQTQTLINEQNQQALQSNNMNRQVMAGMYTACTVGPKLLSIILRILMVITFFAYSQGITLDLNGDGVIDYADVEVYYSDLLQKRQAKEQAARAARSQRPDFDDLGGSGHQAFK